MSPAPSTASGTTRQEIPMKIDAYLFVPGSVVARGGIDVIPFKELSSDTVDEVMRP
jgi:hypothetical protein